MNRAGGRRVRGILFFLLSIAPIFEASCTTVKPVTPTDISLAPTEEFETYLPFRRALKTASGSQDFEKARIEYLLERISKSPYNFIRNEELYTGKRTEAHFRLKYIFNKRNVNTAEEFINKVTTRSKMTGQLYLVEFPNKKRYPLYDILTIELASFDQALETKRKSIAQVSEKAS